MRTVARLGGNEWVISRIDVEVPGGTGPDVTCIWYRTDPNAVRAEVLSAIVFRSMTKSSSSNASLTRCGTEFTSPLASGLTASEFQRRARRGVRPTFAGQFVLTQPCRRRIATGVVVGPAQIFDLVESRKRIAGVGVSTAQRRTEQSAVDWETIRNDG